MTLVTTPTEVLTLISCFLAKNPTDLAHFGAACKKTHATVKGKIFEKLLQNCHQEFLSKKRLSEIWTGGHIVRAYRAMDKAAKTKALAVEQITGTKCWYSHPAQLNISDILEKQIEQIYGEVVENYKRARAQFQAIEKESRELVTYDGNTGNIIGGKIYNSILQIQSEIDSIQNYIRNAT